MTHHVSQSIKATVSADKVWKVMDDFGGIQKYAPTIKESSIVGDKQTGLGAKRKVTFEHDGSSLVEEITQYDEGNGYKMQVSGVSSPLKSMNAEMWVESIDAGSSEIFMSVSFETKMGPLGWVMGKVLMTPIMNGAVKKVLAGLSDYAQNT